jgi:hypothetical protein
MPCLRRGRGSRRPAGDQLLRRSGIQLLLRTMQGGFRRESRAVRLTQRSRYFRSGLAAPQQLLEHLGPGRTQSPRPGIVRQWNRLLRSPYLGDNPTGYPCRRRNPMRRTCGETAMNPRCERMEHRDRAVIAAVLLLFSTLMALALNAGFTLAGRATGYHTFAASSSVPDTPTGR